MDRVLLENLLNEIDGCTFATLDAETEPSRGILKVETGKRIILFTNKKSSGYENMVRRRLIEAGKDPDSFTSGDLPWGTAVPNSPLVEHNDKVYLKVIELAEGRSRYFLKRTMAEANPADLGLPKARPYQGGLPEGEKVICRCYNLDHITRIVLMNETLLADGETRSIVPA